VGQAESIAILVFLGAVTSILLFQRWMVDALIEAINRFRGGPPRPMHPSPAGDVALLRKPTRTGGAALPKE